MFEQECLGIFVSDPLSDLANKYIIQCEEFDRVICSGRYKNIVVPQNKYEYVAINKHARELRKELLLEVEARGFTAQDFQRSIRLITNRLT